MKQDKQSLRIIFYGTPDFAVASLHALLDAGYQVVAVVTAPDKASGRGLQLKSSAVKTYAVQKGLPVLQPEKLKAPEFIAQLESFRADLQVVVAFRMLPEIVWNKPPLGTINVHASLLPQYRGAAPINWALMNGESRTGVTTFKLQQAIDTGNILLQQPVMVSQDDDAGTLHDKLMSAGASLLVRTIDGMLDGSVYETPQDNFDVVLKHAPKLFKEYMKIDWEESGEQIRNKVRGLSPYPAAFTQIQDKLCKVYKVHTFRQSPDIPVGHWDTDAKTYLRFAASDAWVYIEELQLEGKKRMSVADFLKGFRA